MPAGEGPVYTRPGYDPALADPAVQREAKKEIAKRGIKEEDVSEGLAQQGQPEGEQAVGEKRRITVPKDVTIPGLGLVKKGEVVIAERFGPGHNDWRYTKAGR